jgi:hypothetical protein
MCSILKKIDISTVVFAEELDCVLICDEVASEAIACDKTVETTIYVDMSRIALNTDG